jgi:thiol-disulfide isomerase/thioredoxin
MARRVRLLAVTLVVCTAIAVAAVLGLASHPLIGRPAPTLPRESLIGAPVTLASLLAGAHGRPALVVFWASWCTPCNEEAPALERFATSASGRGRIVAVDWSDPVLPDVRQFLRKYAWTFPVLRDAEGLVGTAYRIAVLPTTFVVDSHGRIRAALRGPQSAGSLRTALSSLESS